MLAEVGRVGKPREKYVVMGLNSHVPGRSLFLVIDRTVWNDWVQPEAAYFAEWGREKAAPKSGPSHAAPDDGLVLLTRNTPTLP
jgi:hypothetical protein